MAKNEKPTLEDVARLAKVSTATISRSINEPDKVAKATHDRIQAAISQLAYTPNYGAKVLASNKSNTIGAIIPTMSNAMFASGLQAFQEELAKAGVILLVASSGYDAENELKQIQSLLSHGADGLLLIGSERPQATLDFLQMRNIPYVISWCFKDTPDKLYAGFDNKKAAYNMARQVLDAGHQHIAMIAGMSKGNDRAANRIAGVKAAIDEHPSAKLLQLIETNYSMQNGAKALSDIMTTTLKPTAVICGNDVIAAGAINHAKQSGLRVPQDISITGFDDINLATAVDPQLTTVRVPQIDMGKKAARVLLEYVESKQMPHSIEIETTIIQRGSLAHI
jgi:LacI family transcriptional regulator